MVISYTVINNYDYTNKKAPGDNSCWASAGNSSATEYNISVYEFRGSV